LDTSWKVFFSGSLGKSDRVSGGRLEGGEGGFAVLGGPDMAKMNFKDRGRHSGGKRSKECGQRRKEKSFTGERGQFYLELNNLSFTNAYSFVGFHGFRN